MVKASVDRTGRVQTLDLSNAGVDGGCARALETMLRLSLATPERINSALESGNLLVVKPRGRPLCFDEVPVTNIVSPRHATPSGGAEKAPKVVRRVEPTFPRDVRWDMQGGSVIVVAEAHITRQGCVRNVRLVQQTEWPSLNSAAVLALSEWTFKPGTLDGVPVDVLFNLTINFKLR